MKVAVTKKLIDVDGEELGFRDENGKSVPATGRSVAMFVLKLRFASEEISFDDSMLRHELRKKIAKQDEPDLTAEEIALCKKLVSKVWGSDLTGAFAELYEGKV